MTRSSLRFALAAALVTAPIVVYGCGGDDTTDTSDPDASTLDGGGGDDATTSQDTGAGDDGASPDTGTDAGADVHTLPAQPCRSFPVVDAGDAGDADTDAGDAAPLTVPSGPLQSFSGTMAGCAGSVTFADRAALCNAAVGCAPCNAAQWVANAGGQAPTHQYWVDEALRYSGSEYACGATLEADAAAPNTYTCSPASQPMRVCVDGDGGVPGNGYARASIDSNGNTCNWTHCDFGGPIDFLDAGDGGDATPPTKNLHFGGCNNNPTAGTLCCCP